MLLSVWKKGVLNCLYYRVGFDVVIYFLNIRVLGYLRNIKIIKNKNNEEMAFVEVYDSSLNIELVIFSDLFVRCRNTIDDKHLFIINGRVNLRNGKINIVVNKVERLGM